MNYLDGFGAKMDPIYKMETYFAIKDCNTAVWHCRHYDTFRTILRHFSDNLTSFFVPLALLKPKSHPSDSVYAVSATVGSVTELLYAKTMNAILELPELA